MTARLKYVIHFVADMDRAIAFYRDTLELAVKFATPFWTEMQTGDTTLALHPASPEHPAGSMSVGFGVPDIDAFYAEKSAAGVEFLQPPREQFGARIASICDAEGGEIRVST
jgi:lactoylglutathione lyase